MTPTCWRAVEAYAGERNHHLRLSAQHVRVRGDPPARQAAPALPARSSSTPARSLPRPSARRARRSAAPAAGTPKRRSSSRAAPPKSHPSVTRALPEVDRVLDNRAKLRPQSYDRGRCPTRDLTETAAHLVDGFEGKSRAFLQVQQGCDHRCTFCVIPYARGPSRSVPMGLIADQARRLVAAGYSEIVLTGVDLTAYGADLPGKPSLGQMVRRLLAAVPELARLRLSSLDPAEIDAELWRLLAEEPRLMPHLHLSLQAGDDLILKRMKRRHSRAERDRYGAARPGIAPGGGARRRSDRRLSDRDRGDVPSQPRPDRGMRPRLCPCVSLQPAARHARGANAAAARRGRQGAGGKAAGGGRGRPRRRAFVPHRQRNRGADRAPRAGACRVLRGCQLLRRNTAEGSIRRMRIVDCSGRNLIGVPVQ